MFQSDPNGNVGTPGRVERSKHDGAVPGHNVQRCTHHHPSELQLQQPGERRRGHST